MRRFLKRCFILGISFFSCLLLFAFFFFDLRIKEGHLFFYRVPFVLASLKEGRISYSKSKIDIELIEPVFVKKVSKGSSSSGSSRWVPSHLCIRIHQGEITVGKDRFSFDALYDEGILFVQSSLGFNLHYHLRSKEYSAIFDQAPLAPLSRLWLVDSLFSIEEGKISGSLFSNGSVDLSLSSLLLKKGGEEFCTIDAIEYHSLQGGVLRNLLFSAEGMSDLRVEHLSGPFSFSKEGWIHFDFEGILCQGEQLFPLLIQSKQGEREAVLEIEGKLALESGRLIRYCTLCILPHDSSSYELRGKLDHIGPDECAFLEKLFSKRLIPFEEMQLVDPLFSLEFHAFWQANQLKNISIDEAKGEFSLQAFDQPLKRMGVKAHWDGFLSATIEDLDDRTVLHIRSDEEGYSCQSQAIPAAWLKSWISPETSFDGELDGDFRVKEGEIFGSFSSPCLIYRGNGWLCQSKQTPLYGKFFYDQKGKKLDLHLSLQEVSFRLGDRDIDQLNGQLYFDGKALFIEEMEGRIGKTRFFGRASLDEQKIGTLILEKIEGQLESVVPFFAEVPFRIDGEIFARDGWIKKNFLTNELLESRCELYVQEGSISYGGQSLKGWKAKVELDQSRVRFDLLAEKESIQWIRLKGEWNEGVLFLDQKESHLLQSPFALAEFGVLEGRCTVHLREEEISLLGWLLDLPKTTYLPPIEAHFAFRNGTERMALHLKGDEGELLVSKEEGQFLLSKGSLKIKGQRLSWDSIRYDPKDSLFDASELLWEGQNPDSHLRCSIQGNRLVEAYGAIQGKEFHLMRPVLLKWTGKSCSTEGGSVQIEGIDFSLATFSFDVSNFAFSMDTCRFAVTPESPIYRLIPEEIGSIEGWIRLFWSAQGWSGAVTFTPKVMTFFHEKVQLERAELFFDGRDWTLEGEASYKQHQVAFGGKIVKMASLYAAEVLFEGLGGEGKMELSYEPTIGLRIHETKGTLPFLDWTFVPQGSLQDPERLSLQGSLSLHLDKLPKMMMEKLPRIWRWFNFNEPVRLSGKISIPKESPSRWHIEGEVSARDLSCFGIGIRSLKSGCFFDKQHLFLKEFSVSDPAFLAFIDEVSLDVVNRRFSLHQFKLTHLLLSKLRLSQKGIKKLYGLKRSPLMVESAVLEQFEGTFDAPELWQGHGSLSFLNRAKKETDVFDIPLEIIKQLGLDVNLLEPVVGEVVFEIGEGKVFLNKLKNCFSRGKRSRFFFKPNHASYIGFDGSMQIRIHMKQSVLLKFTQLFTLSVEGTVQKPKVKLK